MAEPDKKEAAYLKTVQAFIDSEIETLNDLSADLAELWLRGLPSLPPAVHHREIVVLTSPRAEAPLTASDSG